MSEVEERCGEMPSEMECGGVMRGVMRAQQTIVVGRCCGVMVADSLLFFFFFPSLFSLSPAVFSLFFVTCFSNPCDA